MFNLGFSELLIIGVLALIFIGPKELPDVARFVGRLLNEFRRATQDLSRSLVLTKLEVDPRSKFQAQDHAERNEPVNPQPAEAVAQAEGPQDPADRKVHGQ